MDKPSTLEQKYHYLQSRAVEVGKQYRWFNEQAFRLFLNLGFTTDAINARFSRYLKMKNLSRGAFNLMVILNHEPEFGVPLSTISDLLQVSRSNVSGLVDSLAKRGLAVRAESPSDRRLRLAILSPAGVEMLEELIPEYYRMISEMLTGLTESEKTTLDYMLTNLRRTTEEFWTNTDDAESDTESEPEEVASDF